MEIRDLLARPALTVRTTTSFGNLPNTVGEAYGAIMMCLQKKGKAPAGNPFVIYYNTDMENLDVEIGFPVEAGVQGEGNVCISQMPGGRAATAMHAGSYETLANTYEALTAFVKDKGLEPETWMWETYLNSPQDTPPDQLRTEIVFPLKK